MKDLISLMLSPENKRSTVAAVLEHPWFSKVDSNEEIELEIEVNRFKKYIHTNSFKKVVLTFIASRIKDNEVANLRETFAAFDSNKDGQLRLMNSKKD